MKTLSLVAVTLLATASVLQAQAPRPAPRTTLEQPQGNAGVASANPWATVPPSPYRNLAEEVKAGSQPGQANPLNPSCEGKTGSECVRSAEALKR